MQKKSCNVQIGKNGINKNLIETLRDAFKTHENVKVSVLKSSKPNREKIKKYKGLRLSRNPLIFLVVPGGIEPPFSA